MVESGSDVQLLYVFDGKLFKTLKSFLTLRTASGFHKLPLDLNL